MNQRRDPLYSIKDVKKDWIRGMSFSSESLKAPGHINAFTWTAKSYKMILETVPTSSKDTWLSLYDRYPFLVLYRKNLPYDSLLSCNSTNHRIEDWLHLLQCIFQQE